MCGLPGKLSHCTKWLPVKIPLINVYLWTAFQGMQNTEIKVAIDDKPTRFIQSKQSRFGVLFWRHCPGRKSLRFSEMATEVHVAAKETLQDQSKITEEQPSLSRGSTSIVADVLSKKGLSTATSVNQAMKELSQRTDGLKVREKWA